MAMVVDYQHDSSFPYWTSNRRRFHPDSSFFSSGNIERELLAKQVALDLTEDERNQLEKMLFPVECSERCNVQCSMYMEMKILLYEKEGKGVFCPIVGCCGARLTSLEDFEDHYNARHTASCSLCSRVYPTSRLLSIHVPEVHDSFFQAKVARGYAMYEWLVEGCGLKFRSYKGRQHHLLDKHKFPTSFEFFKKTHPSKKQRQKNPWKQAMHKKDEEPSSKMEVESETMDGLVSAVSKLSTSDSSPSTISIGRPYICSSICPA
ncbi:hypothetical protein REPUB_Repub09cG0009900 [Reevesia pubescens]